MSTVIRNAIAIIVGLVTAYAVNMGIIYCSPFLVPPPPGTNMSTAAGIRAAMQALSPIHFVMPFLAHALGSFAGGWMAAFVGVKYQMELSLSIGVVFLVLGIVMVSMVGGPVWFIVVDLLFAFVPMAWLGGRLALHSSRQLQRPSNSQ